MSGVGQSNPLKVRLIWNLRLASFFEGQVTVASGHDSTFLHFFESELSSFLGHNASCCDFNQLCPRLADVALQVETGALSARRGVRQKDFTAAHGNCIGECKVSHFIPRYSNTCTDRLDSAYRFIIKQNRDMVVVLPRAKARCWRIGSFGGIILPLEQCLVYFVTNGIFLDLDVSVYCTKRGKMLIDNHLTKR